MSIRSCFPAYGAIVVALLLMVTLAPEAVTAAPVPQQASTATAAGRPPANYAMPQGSVFSFPNRGKPGKVAIRNRVLKTINSVWGGPRDRYGAAMSGNGTIRITTWSFNDQAIAKALYAAHRRGVSVQVVAAGAANKKHKPWKYLRARLSPALHASGRPQTAERWSFARQCSGACRGPGGAAHAKFFLFTNVGSRHVPHVTVQTSMNLTRFAYMHQWNQSTTSRSGAVHHAFLSIFRELRRNVSVYPAYREYPTGNITNIFFPRRGATAATDPIMQALRPVRCTGATSGGVKGRTRIRVIQYAIYQNRGNWIAKRLRQLWNQGCDVRVIYSVTSRPVLRILRAKGKRGPVPMKQSVVKGRRGVIKKYNHSKWLSITGRYGSSRGTWLVLPGSANWADLALTSDEQMQRINSAGWTRPYLKAFTKTWKQKSSRKPPRIRGTARMIPGVPEQPTFGRGIYRHLDPD